MKIESVGIAHEWDTWKQLLRSEDLFDLYTGFVTLITDEHYCYSCGMHHFDLPELTSASLAARKRRSSSDESVQLLPNLGIARLGRGHTFSLSADSPRFELSRVDDVRYPADHLFHNAHGLWDLR